MVEPVTTLTGTAIAAYWTKDGLNKLLGPTADYLGQGLKDFVQKRKEIVAQILQNAESKLGDRIDSPGEVPPKVLKAIIDDGSFSNDKLAVEYLGGILASSRTELGRDDRGARTAKIVDRLSTYQLRTHFLIYSTIREIFSNKGFNFNLHDRPKMQIYIPFSGYIEAMDFNKTELEQVNQITNHIFFGLHSEDLIEGMWQIGPKEDMVRLFAGASEDGVICAPSALGAELFLWAFGHSDKLGNFIFDQNFFPVVDGIASIKNASATRL